MSSQYRLTPEQMRFWAERHKRAATAIGEEFCLERTDEWQLPFTYRRMWDQHAQNYLSLRGQLKRSSADGESSHG